MHALFWGALAALAKLFGGGHDAEALAHAEAVDLALGFLAGNVVLLNLLVLFLLRKSK